MSGRQGFITNGQTYVYQESNVGTSAASGLDLADSGRWKLAVSPTVGAIPSGTAQIAIDITTPGDIEITPNTGGVLYVNNSDTTIYGAHSSTTANGLNVVKSRNYGVITTGDDIGFINFQGFDGTNDKSAAKILSTSSGTIGTGRVAGNLQFFTAPNSVSTSLQRMVIAPTGAITINSPDSGTALTITAGGLTVTAGSTTLTPLNASGLVANNSSGVLSTTATTNHSVQLGNSSGQLSSLSVGTNGQILVGATTADPSWVTPTAGTGLSITTNATTLAYALSAPVSIANGGTNATSMTTTDGVVYYDGTRLVTTTAGTSGQVLTSNGAGVAPTYQAAGGSGAATFHTDGSDATVSGSAITMAGSTNITTSGASATVTFSLVSSPSVAGSVTAGTNIISTAGNIAASAGIIRSTTSSSSIAARGLMAETTSSTTATGGILQLQRQHGNGGDIVSGDTIGEISFQGLSSSYVVSSRIVSVSSGTVAASRVASDLEFFTHPDSTTAATQRMVIAPTGAVTINAPDSGVGLTIAGGGLTSTGTTTLSSLNSAGAVQTNGSGVLSTGTLSIANGGTNATSFATTDGVVYFDGTRLVTTAVGTSGYVLTSNGAGVAPTFQAGGGGGGIVTLNGDSGSATGATVTIAGGSNITTSATSATVTVALASSPSVSGSLTAGTTVTATSGNITATNGSISVGNTAASSAASDVDFLKSRSGGVITTGDSLGIVTFKGHDGTGYITASQIKSVNSGTVATNRIASDLEFYTHPDSTSASTQRVVIASTGATTINAPDSGVGLTIAGGGLTVTAGTTTLTPLNASGLVANNASGVLSTTATTTHAVQVGNASGQLTSLGVGTNGQVLIGGTTADPSWVTPAAGTGLSITTNSTTLSYALSAPVSIANGGTNATSMTTTDGVVYYDGTRLVTTTAGTSGQVLTSNGAGVAPTYQAAGGGGGMTWTEVTGTTQSMAVANGYILNNASLVTATLPSTAAVGDIVSVVGKGAGGWLVAQNSGQLIHFGSSTTTTGVGGSLASTLTYDCLDVICIVANTTWVVRSSVGNLTVV